MRDSRSRRGPSCTTRASPLSADTTVTWNFAESTSTPSSDFESGDQASSHMLSERCTGASQLPSGRRFTTHDVRGSILNSNDEPSGDHTGYVSDRRDEVTC